MDRVHAKPRRRKEAAAPWCQARARHRHVPGVAKFPVAPSFACIITSDSEGELKWTKSWLCSRATRLPRGASPTRRSMIGGARSRPLGRRGMCGGFGPMRCSVSVSSLARTRPSKPIFIRFTPPQAARPKRVGSGPKFDFHTCENNGGLHGARHVPDTIVPLSLFPPVDE